MFKFNPAKLNQGSNTKKIIRKSGIYDVRLTSVSYSDGYGGAFDIEGETEEGTIFCKLFLTKRDGSDAFGMFVMNSILGVLGINEISDGSELNGRDIKIALKVTNKLDGDTLKFSQHYILAVFNLDGKEYGEIKGNKPATRINAFSEIETVEEKIASKASFKMPTTAVSTVNVSKPVVEEVKELDVIPF